MDFRKWPAEKQDKVFAVCSVIIAAVIMAAILVIEYFSMKQLSGQYTAIMSADLSQGYKAVLSYNDHLYARIGFMTEILPTDGNKSHLIAQFINSSLSQIDERILSCGVLYVMLIATATVFYRHYRAEGDGSYIIRNTVATVIGLYVLYGLAVTAMQFLLKIPLKLPSFNHLVLLAVSLVCVITGVLALSLVLRFIPFRKTAALVAIPLAFLLFLFGFNNENGLYTSKTINSFDYVYEKEPQVLQEGYTGAYYDEKRNVMIVEGKEYQPQQVENPEYATGFGRVMSIGFEAINPYSGMSLAMLQETLDNQIPLKATALYGIRTVILAVLLIVLRGKDE